MDQSMICLPSDVKTALEKTNFIKRYEMLSNTFNGERTPLNERLRYIDGEIVLDSLAQLGYKAHFESKEKYFWIEEVQIGTYTFSGNMILDGGLVDIVWIVKEKRKSNLRAANRRIFQIDDCSKLQNKEADFWNL